MRTKLALSLLIVSGATSAQNWALLNPAYKYNYSNDGTDTISNQIFITHIDTLGLDSFRYELNRIGVVCDTCFASLGGPCDGCFVWVDQPQLFQRSVVVSPGGWLFLDPDTFLIRTDLPIASSWPFKPDGSITGTFTSQAPASVFGSADSIRVITLSSGDTVVISASYGVLAFPGSTGTAPFLLKGVGGPDVGSVLPEPLDFFRYNPGDELQYRIEVQYYDPGNPFPFQNAHEIRKVRIWGVDSIADGYNYHYTLFRSGHIPDGVYAPNWMDFGSDYTWTVTSDYLAQEFAPLSTYPSATGYGDCNIFPPLGDTSVMMLMHHSIDQQGRYSIDPVHKPLDDTYGNQIFLDHSAVPGFPRLYPFGWFGGAASFKEGIGLIQGSFTTNFEGGCWIDFIGADINGTLMGSLTPDDEMEGPLGVLENPHFQFTIRPNPASAYVDIRGLPIGETLTIHDMSGKLRLNLRVAGETTSIRVADWQEGVYVVRILGRAPMLMTVVH